MSETKATMMRTRFILAGFLLLAFPGALFSQNPTLQLLSIDTRDFPTTRAHFFINSADGAPIRDLLLEDFQVTENGVPVETGLLTCASDYSPEQISSVLAIDISASMFNSGNLEIAKSAARLWVETMPLGYSECAVTSFNQFSYLNRDLSIDRDGLLTAIDGLEPGGGTDYNAGLIRDPGGAVAVAARGSYRPVVIFLTDGVGDIDENAIVRAANDVGATVHVLVLRMDAPEELRDIAERTGGLIFDNITTEGEAKSLYAALLRLSQGERPCELTWRSKPDCTPVRSVSIDVQLYDVSWSYDYRLPDTVRPTLALTPIGQDFGLLLPGASDQRRVTLTARYRPVTVTGVSGLAAPFSILSGLDDLPFTLQPGESRDVVVGYAPNDSLYRYARLEFESNACAGGWTMFTGGLPGLRAPETTMRLTTPNGGERFTVGSAVPIEWEGVLPGDTVLLEYSIDGGENWMRITDSATELRYLWTAPPTPSDRCLMRVRQLTAGGRNGVVIYSGSEVRLQDVDFDPTGTLAVTGGDGDSVVIFNTFDGKAERVLPGHETTVYTTKFNPSGDRVVVGTGRYTSALWDADNGTEIRRLSAPPYTFLASDFSPDGANVVSHTYEGRVIVTDTANNLVADLANGNFGGLAIEYGPDGTVLAASNNGAVVLWDMTTGTMLHYLSAHTATVNAVSFSPDGSRLLTAASDSALRIWDVGTGDMVKEFILPYRISGAKFDPSGNRMLVFGFRPDVEIRDAATGELMQTLSGHTKTAIRGDWSKDGSRVATASWDHTARIWDLGTVPNQTDESDDLWAIVAAEIECGSIDLGRVDIGRSRDSVVAGWICNNGSAAVLIDSISLPPGSPFSLVSGMPPFKLAPGECRPIEFRFRPGRVADFADSAVVHFGADSAAGILRGTGLAPMLRAVVESVDFGEVPVGGLRDTIVSVALRNVGTIPLWIDRTYSGGPDNDQFTLLNGGGAFGLNPGETRSLEIRFSPVRVGRTSGSILFSFDGAGNMFFGLDPIRVELLGEGICPEARSADVYLPAAVEAAAGDRVAVPLLSRGEADAALEGAGYTAVLRFNRTMLAPLDSVAFDAIVGDERIVIVEGRASGGDTVGIVALRSALGSVEVSDLRLESFIWNDGCDAVGEGSAEFRLTDLCREGGIRLFATGDSIFLRPVRPNPVRETAEIEYGLLEGGRTRLSLLDASGNLVLRLVDADLAPGEYLLPLDVSHIPNGAYFLLLETPTQLRTGRLQVER